jgi:hypothetical protein
MKKQLAHISIHQTSKVIAYIYFLLSLIILIPVAAFVLFYTQESAQAVFLFILPFFYLVCGYLATALFCFFYNKIAGMAGGIEFTLTNVE